MLLLIHEILAELGCGNYVVALDVSRQYFQVYTKNPNAQCVLYRKTQQDPILVYKHRGLIMRTIFSSNQAGSCTIESGAIFDKMVKQARQQKLDMSMVYPPLEKAMYRVTPLRK